MRNWRIDLMSDWRSEDPILDSANPPILHLQLPRG
jgi:hypothetical protein